VRVVEAKQGPELVAERPHLAKPSQGSVHREDAVGEHQLVPGSAFLGRLQLRAQVLHVVVPIAQVPGAAQADAVHDRGVIERPPLAL
jgi:hypothetical protein